jgi:hypothetical protein
VDRPGVVVTAAVQASPTASADMLCDVAYADRGAIVCLSARGGVAQVAAGLAAGQPEVAPDGQTVAFTVRLPDGSVELWASGLQPERPARRLVGAEHLAGTDPAARNEPRHYQWLPGTRLLVFDTRRAAAAPGADLNADLWLVDADTGQLRPVLGPGQAGDFSVAPDGLHIALARPTGVDLLHTPTLQVRRDVLTFPAVVTPDGAGYRPAAAWRPDSQALHVAVPSPDPLAPQAHVLLYQVSVAGPVAVLGALPGNYVSAGRLAVSPDGRFVASVPPPAPGSPEQVAVRHATGRLAMPAQEAWSLVLGGWSPDSRYFALASQPAAGPVRGQVLDLALTQAQPLAPLMAEITALRWLDAGTLVYVARFSGGERGLFRQSLGQEPRLLAAGLSEQITLDVR